jgi:hypothetical protein
LFQGRLVKIYPAVSVIEERMENTIRNEAVCFIAGIEGGS